MHAELKKRGQELIAAAEFLEQVEAVLAKHGIGRQGSEWVMEVGFPERMEKTRTRASGGTGNTAIYWGMSNPPHSAVTAYVELHFVKMGRANDESLFKTREARLVYFTGDSPFYSFSVYDFDKHCDSDFPEWDPTLAEFLLARHVPLGELPKKRPSREDVFEIVETVAKFYAGLRWPEACATSAL